MNTLLIKSKDQSNLKLLKEIAKKLGGDVFDLDDEQVEDIPKSLDKISEKPIKNKIIKTIVEIKKSKIFSVIM